VIHELSTGPWLVELSRRLGRTVTLADVPAEAWDAVVLPGTDAVWLMGVWTRSRAGRQIALADPDVRREIAANLADATDDDVVASPYCIAAYVVDPAFGGPAGLVSARAALAARGVRLVLDFVPNHVAPDHPWVTEHPEFFVHGTDADLAAQPPAYRSTPSGPLAMGKDPYFAPWKDVLQLNLTSPGLRRAVVATLADVAGQCDGVRCDMAMLALDDVVRATWGDRVDPVGPEPYWTEVISAVRAGRADFMFAAEAYWDREPDLIAQGFDHCYDKRLYDRLAAGDAGSVRDHLGADPAYQHHLLRFVENHDEPRAAATFPTDRGRAAGVVVATTPGALLVFLGQLAGRRDHYPVQEARWPDHTPDPGVEAWWHRLLAALADHRVRTGRWSLLPVAGWPDNQSCQRLLAWQWVDGDHRHLVVVNFSDAPADGRIAVAGTAGRPFVLTDRLTGTTYDRSGDEMDPVTSPDGGLYVALGPWAVNLFGVEPS
jgi:glycosidase